jgi:hypothetical protein
MIDTGGPSKSLSAIWERLLREEAMDIAVTFWTAADSWCKSAALMFLAKQYNTRRQTVARWPVDRLTQKLLTRALTFQIEMYLADCTATCICLIRCLRNPLEI